MATIEADYEKIKRLELAGFASWPEQILVQDGQWLLRMSPALPFRRTNSINFLDVYDDADACARLNGLVAKAKKNKLVPTIRETPLTPKMLMNEIRHRGWQGPFAPTDVMLAHKLVEVGSQSNDILIELEPVPVWLTAYCSLCFANEIDSDAIAEALHKISFPSGFFRIQKSNEVLAVAVGVVTDCLVGIFGLAVHPEFRGQGIAGKLSHAVFSWGAKQNAEVAWLQVESSNHPAKRLYHKLGFVSLYRYQYWMQNPPNNI